MAPNIPKTCKAGVVEKAGDKVVIKEVPVEQPKEGEILIKVHACGVCHSDSATQEGHMGPLYVLLLLLLLLLVLVTAFR
jgi:D-arabinose 1-dehydrogenase-like Zn-dependent alcohol dehydrogenase